MLTSYEKLGIVFVPKNVPKNTSVIKVKSEKFQDILEKLKTKIRMNKMNQFKVISKFNPTGDQPKAIKSIAKGIEKEKNFKL